MTVFGIDCCVMCLGSGAFAGEGVVDGKKERKEKFRESGCVVTRVD